MRITRDNIILVLTAFSLFGRRGSEKREMASYYADAVMAYDDLRGLGDRVEQASYRDEGLSMTPEEVKLLTPVVRALRAAAIMLKGRTR